MEKVIDPTFSSQVTSLYAVTKDKIILNFKYSFMKICYTPVLILYQYITLKLATNLLQINCVLDS